MTGAKVTAHPSDRVTGAHAVGYVRVSTSEQVDSGLGLTAQRTAITSAAERLGLDLVEVFEDAGVSGRAPLENRPGLASALAALRRGSVLLTAKRDRIARDVMISILIEREAAKRGARIISAAGEGTESDDPSAIFTRRILDSVAELERSLIAARTRAALQALKAKGKRAGTLPFGYNVAADGMLVPDDREQQIIRRVRELREQGRTFKAISDVLNSEGHLTRRGTGHCEQYVWEYAQLEPVPTC